MADSSRLQRFASERRQSLLNALAYMKDMTFLTDVTLLCDGKSHPAHRVALAAGSGYFREIFQKKQRVSKINVHDADHETFGAVLHFIYTGRLWAEDVEDGKLGKVLSALRSLDVHGLENIATSTIKQLITVNNFFSLWDLVKELKLKNAECEIVKFVSSNLKECCHDHYFSLLSLQQMISVLSSKYLCVDSSSVILEAVAMWGSYQQERRAKYLTSMLSVVGLTPDPKLFQDLLSVDTLTKVLPLIQQRNEHSSASRGNNAESQSSKTKSSAREARSFTSDANSKSNLKPTCNRKNDIDVLLSSRDTPFSPSPFPMRDGATRSTLQMACKEANLRALWNLPGRSTSPSQLFCKENLSRKNSSAAFLDSHSRSHLQLPTVEPNAVQSTQSRDSSADAYFQLPAHRFRENEDSRQSSGPESMSRESELKSILQSSCTEIQSASNNFVHGNISGSSSKLFKNKTEFKSEEMFVHERGGNVSPNWKENEKKGCEKKSSSSIQRRHMKLTKEKMANDSKEGKPNNKAGEKQTSSCYNLSNGRPEINSTDSFPSLSENSDKRWAKGINSNLSQSTQCILCFGLDSYGLPVNQCYSPGLNLWHGTKRSFRLPAENMSILLCGRHMYLIGGETPRNVKLATTYTFCLDDQNVIKRANMSVARSEAGITELLGLIYVTGGRGNTQKPISHVEFFNPKTNAWRPVANLRRARILPSVTTADKVIYVVGGCLSDNFQFNNTCEYYDQSVNQWTEMCALPLSFSKTQVRITCHHERVYAMQCLKPEKLLHYLSRQDKWVEVDSCTSICRLIAFISCAGSIWVLDRTGKFFTFNDVNKTWSQATQLPQNLNWPVQVFTVDNPLI